MQGTGAAARPAVASSATEELYDFLAPPQGPGEIGWLGSYRVLKVLGAGGMGVVFQAEDPQLQRLVALKAMLPSLAASPSAKQRFLREARAAAAIKHDHIVTIHQVGEDRGAPFLAMEFLEGEPLDERLKHTSQLPLAEVLRIGRETAEGLAAAHKRGLIHRDIKPANLWLEGERGRVKILDFGLARSMADQTNLTQAGAIVGTPAYMAPEQATAGSVDHRCDLFSLGCVLYRLATGELPFKGDNTLAILAALALETPKPPRELDPQLPPELSELIVRLLAKDPKDRPQSAQEVVTALEAIARQPDDVGAASASTAQTEAGLKRATPPSKAVHAGKKPAPQGLPDKHGPRSRRKWVAAALAAVLGGGLLAGVIIIIKHRDGSQTRLEVEGDNKARIDTKGQVIIEPNEHRPAPVVPLGASPFDLLQRAAIPPEELKVAGAGDPALAPKELVAVLGESRLKHWLGVSRVAFSADGKRLITTDSISAGYPTTNKVRVWDAETGRELSSFLMALQAITFNADGTRLATYSSSGTSWSVKVWDVAAGKELFTTPEHQAGVMAVSFSADGKRLATGSGDKTVMVFDTTTGQLDFTLKGSALPVRGVALNTDGSQVATAASGEKGPGEVKIWDANGKEIASLTGHTSPVARLAFSPNGRHLAAAALDRRGWVWDLPAGGKPRELAGQNVNSNPVFSPDSKRLVLNDNIYDAAFGQKLPSLPFTGDYVRGVAWSLDGKRLAAVGGSCIRVFDAASGQPVLSPGPLDSAIRVVAVSPDGRRIAVGAQERAVKLFETATGRLLHTCQTPEWPTQLVFSPDGAHLAGAFLAKNILVWDSATGALLRSWTKHADNVLGLAYSPDGRHMVSCSRDGVKVWDAQSGEDLCSFPGHTGGTYSVAFSPDGKRVVSGGRPDKAVKVWEIQSRKELHTLAFPEAGGHDIHVTFSPDGRRVAAGSVSQCKVWDAHSGEKVLAPAGSAPFAYSPDGALLVGRSESGKRFVLSVWDGKSGAVRRQWQLPGQFDAVAVAPDGRHIITGNVNGTLYVFRLATAPAKSAK